jgi:hypothetical protein
MKKTGTLSYITPSAWIYEDSSLNLRKHIFTNYNLHYFYQFENKKKIFPAVDSRYKFAIFQISQQDFLPNLVNLKALPVRFMKTDTNILYENNGQNEILGYPYEDIYKLSPQHWALFEVKSAQDLAIIRKIYQKFAPLNPNFMDFRNELHITADRDIFKEKHNNMVLYEGKMIHQFKNSLAEAQYWVSQNDFENRMNTTEISRLVSDIYAQLSEKNGQNHRKKVLHALHLQESDLKKWIVLDSQYPRLCFRSIARNTDMRTLIAGIIPQNHTFGNSLFGHIPKKYRLNGLTIEIQSTPLERVLFTQSIFNSLITDYIIRFMVDSNVNKTYLMRLPMPQPQDAEFLQNDLYKKIIINTLKINLVNNSNLNAVLHSFILSNGLKIDLPKTEKQKIFLQIDNDCLIAKLYGLTYAELAHLTSAEYFKILNEQQPEYISALLAKYEEMGFKK